ncbi:PucR family transcriptional regulator [Rhodococcus fascians]|nr:PucR family transcriptional regulator [Rhodococcus fascians]MBY4238367.1 PucR family transcriptional regulator [Rhodococcus fascians]MBY4254252.1 PucR family transcriptional regulator [Rhodococcus fascians]MBY4269633.1 PucR family transcriptional regulator [Rhodococcus fascians]
MASTVRRLSQRADLGLSIVAGLEGADQVIEWAHPIELADPTPWLSGGELVMTTGLKIGVRPEEQFAYVSGLVQAGTVALAFDTGTTYDRVPDGIRSAGDALGLPILSVPASTPFIAITRAVIDELTADQLRGVQRVVDHQENFARATLRGGIPSVISALGRALSSSVAVIDDDSRVLAVHGSDSNRMVTIARAVADSARSGSGQRRRTSKVVADDVGYCTIQSISAAQNQFGYLAVSSPKTLPPSDRLLLAHAVSLVSIELSKPAKVVDANQRLRTSTTQALLSMGNSLDVSVLRYFGFDSDSLVAAIAFTQIGPLLPAEKLAAAELAGRSTPYLMSPSEHGLLVVLPADRAAELGPQVQQHMEAQLQRPVVGGLGTAVPLFDAEVSARQATLAARSNPRSRFIGFAELGTIALWLGEQSAPDMRALAHGTLGMLDEYDRQHPGGTGLVATLAAFLECNGEREVAAATLGVHRHTMRNRLNKITELTVRNLDSAHVRAELWVALKARELSGPT